MIFEAMDVTMVARKAVVYIKKGNDSGFNLKKHLYLQGERRKDIEKQSEESPGQDKTA